MVVKTSWLADHIKDPGVVVLQVGTRAQFDSVHIPGAQPVTMADISITSPVTKLLVELPEPDSLKQWAELHGISNASRIIIVPFDSTLQSATRVFVTLAYMGAMDRTSLLDGGLQAWRAEHRAITADPTPAPARASFRLALHPELIAHVADVEKAIADKRTTIIDARLPRFFNGDGGGYPREGHIPEAINVPLNTVSEHGFLKDSVALRKLLLESGVNASKPVVTYCHIGQQGSLLWFVATMLGYDAKLYDGSFQEWSGTPRLPVVGKP